MANRERMKIWCVLSQRRQLALLARVGSLVC